MKSGVGEGGGGCLVCFCSKSCVNMSFVRVCAHNCGLPSLLSLAVSLSPVIFVIVTFLLSLLSLSSRGYQCLHARIPSAAGPPQGLTEGLRHEAAQQIRDDQAVRLCLLLGGEAHHGLFQQSLGRAGVPIDRFYPIETTQYQV